MTPSEIPRGLWPHFQEYNPQSLHLDTDANLIIQRTLEFGDWDEVRWIFSIYGSDRIRLFIRERGDRLLSPVVFNYWRKLLGIEDWRRSPFPTKASELWPQPF